MSSPKQQKLDIEAIQDTSPPEKQRHSNDRGVEDSDNYTPDDEDYHKIDWVSEAEDYEDEDSEEGGNDDKRSTGRGEREKYRQNTLRTLREK
jgi:hypothetical protein